MDCLEDPRVIEELEKAAKWADASSEVTTGLKFETTPRVRISCTYYAIAHEHQRSLVLLMGSGFIASGKAMFRPQFDAFARGAWFHEIATDEQVKAFIEGDAERIPPKKYENLLDPLDKVDRFGTSFSRMREEILPLLHDFTHGGRLQVGGYTSPTSIKSSFKPEDVIAILRASAAFGLLVCNELAGNCKDDQASSRLYEAHGEIYGPDHGKFDLKDLDE